MSNKYTFVPTLEILDHFDREGWEIRSAKQIGGGEFAQHEIRLRNKELPMVGDSLVEAVIRNSHNGSKSFSVDAGLFRLVCKNGLTVPTSIYQSISVRHMNINVGEIRKITDTFAEQMPVIQKSVNKMENTFLTESQLNDFVGKASLLRWTNDSKPLNLNTQGLILPQREEDKGNSVWKIFNVVQEKFVKGGLKYKSTKGRMASLRELKNFQTMNKINTGLWELAESYC